MVDFYREMVEHPQFVPEDVRKTVDFRRWNERGRIWRIVPKDAPARSLAASIPHPAKAGTSDLVALLGHANGWWRDTAQRLLVERQDRAAVPALTDALRTSKEPLARLHALWTLDGLGALDEPSLALALHDPHPDVREGAVRLAGRLPGLSGDLLALADDREVRVRFQAAIALGDLDDGRAPAPWPGSPRATWATRGSAWRS